MTEPLPPSLTEPVHAARFRLAGIIALQLAALAIAWWVRTESVLWVFLAVLPALFGLIVAGRGRKSLAIAGAFMVFALLAALGGERHLEVLSDHWEERSSAWEANAQDELEIALDDLLRGGEESAADLAMLWRDGMIAGPPALPPSLRRPGVDALALFGPGGDLLAWDGHHQGPIPSDARGGVSRYIYRDGALFGYFYVTVPLAEGLGTAVAASLLRSELPPSFGGRSADFRSTFLERAGARIDVTRPDRASGESIWDLSWEGGTLFSVALLPPTEGEVRSRRAVAWARIVTLLLLAGWFYSIVGSRGLPLESLLASGSLLPLLLLLPLGKVTGWSRFFSPGDFLLPGPLPLTLGDLLALSAGGVLAVGIIPWERLPPLPRWIGVASGIAGSLAVLRFFEIGASRDLLATGEGGWVAFQGTATALVLLLFWIGGTLGKGWDREEGGRHLVLGLSLASGVGLALGWTFLVGRGGDAPLWFGLFWLLPLWGVSVGAPSSRGWAGEGGRWLSLLFLATTLVLPWGWGVRVEARIVEASESVDRLGTRPDPFLEFLLRRMGDEAIALSEEGRNPVEILYRAWTESGMAWEGNPLWITYWSPDGTPQEELRIGVADQRPGFPLELLEEVRGDNDIVVRRFDLAEAHYVAVAPLPLEAWISVVVPPRRALAGASPFGPLFSPAQDPLDPLVLVPLLPGEAPGETEGIRWVPARGGLQGETFLAYPDGVYHAHYLLALPGWVLLLARGTLLLLLNGVVFGLLWSWGRWLGEGRAIHPRLWLRALRSFRWRVTLALFAFFLIPSVLFGTLAYRTLSGAAVRTAEALVERAAEDASAWYAEVDGSLEQLARRVGSDLLLYEGGDLVRGSLPELVELGLYGGWLLPEIHEEMARGERLLATSITNLGGWEYVVAYRRIPGGRVLAVPAPLQAGAMALRQRDVADLIGFAVIMGGLLSILLSLMVGRTLARPIQTLQVASERVGAGNMSVRLPEARADEFGAVFDAFNRMVDRLAQTRRALLRSSRRTRAIVEEVATGVVALDPQGRVRLANPKAEELLGTPLEVGALLPHGDSPQDPRWAFAEWVEGYFRDALGEAGTELSFGERRVRVRARRISRKGPPGGAVLSLEDVTDELRSERILAWGEMAQQVAHEVKNPLTPIKLGVQHIQRAWEDGKPDYDAILNRNVEAILREIDRLAAIASSFSRFAAPTPAGAAPLEPVDLPKVVGEVLDLYAAGGGPVEFLYSEKGDLPPVLGRSGELKEVLINLLENARAALQSGGTVWMEAEWRGGVVELAVRDNGTGIPPELITRIFDPHFSTRTTGTGLGLAIVRRLVESWGGRVQAESWPGKGTVLRIRLRPWSAAGEADTTSIEGARGGVDPSDS